MYREYATGTGYVSRHSNGQRLGTRDRIDHPSAREMLANAHPDSLLWMDYAQSAQRQLHAELGDERYLEFVELIMPGNSHLDMTWKEIADMTEAALALCRAHDEHDVDILAGVARDALAKDGLYADTLEVSEYAQGVG